MSADRVREKAELVYQLGALFGPLERFAAAGPPADPQAHAVALARYAADYPLLRSRMEAFCSSEPGHHYAVQSALFYRALIDLIHRVINEDAAADFATLVSACRARAFAAVHAVPADATALFPAGSPFRAYSALRDLCAGDVATELAWVDPYHGPSVFYRYLRHVPEAAAVVLVAAEPRAGAHPNPSDVARWNKFLDASRLYAQERGPARYRLVAHPAGAMHGRWLRLDGRRLYSLDGSAKDAGERHAFAITAADPQVAGPGVQSMIDAGRELFGPATPHHQPHQP